MLESIGKKFIHCFVIASIVFGCSVQAATPSFQEDLDDFEELQSIADGNSFTPAFEPLAILWQNEDLSQTVASSHGVADDFEKYIVQAGAISLLNFLEYSLKSSYIADHQQIFSVFHQARAPPVII